jgi:RHS repeat-associated protein
MVDEVGIIHMNGRIYDPKLGRFLQADPFIQDAFDTQLFNRYSYTRNNPLNATDPSGYIIPVIVGIILIAAEVELVTAVIIMGVTVFADTLIRGGSLQDAFLAGISAAAMTYVGGRLFPQGSFGLNSETFRFVATVATVGGITASLQGGNFGNGFMTAGISAAVGGAVGSSSTFGGSLGPSGRIIAKAVVGGTLSHISGGKFANGAITAAFAYAVSYGVEAVKASYRPQGAIDNSPVVVPEGYEGSIPKAAAEMITAAEPDLADAVDKATIMQGADSDFEGLKDSVPAFARNTTIVIRPGKSLSLYVLSHEIDHVYRYLTVPDFNYKYSEQTKLLRSIGYTEDEAYYGNSYEKRAEIRARSVMRYHNICMRPDCAE